MKTWWYVSVCLLGAWLAPAALLGSPGSPDRAPELSAPTPSLGGAADVLPHPALLGEAAARVRRERQMKVIRLAHPRLTGSVYDVTKIHGDLEIDPENQTLTANVTFDVTVNPGQTLSEEYFQIDSYESVNVLLDGGPADFEVHQQSYGGEVYYYIEVVFDPALAEGTEHTLTFEYTDNVDCTSTGIFGIPTCIFTPERVVFVMNTWIPLGYTGYETQLYTSDLTLTCPSGLVGAVTGDLVSTTINGTKTSYRYVMDSPYSGGALVAAEYELFSHTSAGNVETNVRLYQDTEFGPAWAAFYAAVLDGFGADYGAYPTPYFHVNQIPDSVGAGLGFYNGILIPESSLGHAPDDYYDSIHAHETAHNWFPGIVLNNEDYAAWLSEGFAEYSTIQYAQRRLSDNFFPAYMRAYTAQIIHGVPERDWLALSGDPDLYDDETAYFLTTYYKGALVLMMLNNLYGDEAWFSAMRGYVEKFYYKIASTQSLRVHLTDSLGESQYEFFQEWVSGKGYPRYLVEVVKSRTDTGWETTVRVSQPQTPVFHTRLEIVFFASDSAENQTATTTFTDRSDAFETTFVSVSEPGRVGVDPYWKLHRLVQPALAADANTSGEVDGTDLLYFARSYNSSVWESYDYMLEADTDMDGAVDSTDWAALETAFGTVAVPAAGR